MGGGRGRRMSFWVGESIKGWGHGRLGKWVDGEKWIGGCCDWDYLISLINTLLTSLSWW